MLESGDETDYLFEDEQHCQEAFFSWWPSPKDIWCSCSNIPGEKPLQSTTVVAAELPKGRCVQSNEIVVTELTTVSLGFGPQPLKFQMDALCGDWAVPDQEFDDVEPRRDVMSELERHPDGCEPQPLKCQVGVLFGDLAVPDQEFEDVEPRREVRPEMERHPEEMELEARLEELQVEGRCDPCGESQAEQQEEMHGQDLNEFKAMRVEDFQSWWVRECSRCPLKSPAAVPASQDEDNPAALAAAAAAAAPADVGLGRVILEARLSCREDIGIDVILEQPVLQLHLYEREVDAARCFLDDHNELSPSFVRRYQQPLSRWLQSKLQAAPQDIAFNKHTVEGDLEEILRCHGSGV